MIKLLGGVFLVSLLISGCSTGKNENADAYAKISNGLSHPPINEKSLQELTAHWPESSQRAIRQMTSKHGLPQEATISRIVWYNSTPFKRSVVYKEEIFHHFPNKHSDVLEQVLDYKVPFNKVDDLWNFNGSILLSRTKGEISSVSDSEETNIMALNLAHEVITDRRTGNEARKEYTKMISDFMKGMVHTHMQALIFDPSEKPQDPDITTIKEEIPKNAQIH